MTHPIADKEQAFDKIIDKLVTKDFFNDKTALTEKELQFLENNPNFLDKFTNVEFIKRKYILALFYISISMAITAKIIDYSQVVAQNTILNDLLCNVQFSVAMEMLGASITAYFLEVSFDKRMKKNRALLNEFRHWQNIN